MKTKQNKKTKKANAAVQLSDRLTEAKTCDNSNNSSKVM